MQKSRFTEEQIAYASGRVRAAHLCHTHTSKLLPAVEDLFSDAKLAADREQRCAACAGSKMKTSSSSSWSQISLSTSISFMKCSQEGSKADYKRRFVEQITAGHKISTHRTGKFTRPANSSCPPDIKISVELLGPVVFLINGIEKGSLTYMLCRLTNDHQSSM